MMVRAASDVFLATSSKQLLMNCQMSLNRFRSIPPSYLSYAVGTFSRPVPLTLEQPIRLLRCDLTQHVPGVSYVPLRHPIVKPLPAYHLQPALTSANMISSPSAMIDSCPLSLL